MQKTDRPPEPELTKRGRPRGSRNKAHDVGPELAHEILHEIGNLPESRGLTLNQVYDKASYAIYLRLYGRGLLADRAHRTSNLKRIKMFLLREQKPRDDGHLSAKDRLLDNWCDHCSCHGDFDPETEPCPGRPPSLEAWAGREMDEIDNQFPILPQGVLSSVANDHPAFIFPPRPKATRRRR